MESASASTPAPVDPRSAVGLTSGTTADNNGPGNSPPTGANVASFAVPEQTKPSVPEPSGFGGCGTMEGGGEVSNKGKATEGPMANTFINKDGEITDGSACARVNTMVFIYIYLLFKNVNIMNTKISFFRID